VVDSLRRIGRAVRRLGWWRFAAGALAGTVALALTFLLRVLGIGVFLPQIAVDFIVARIPGSIESFFIRTMGEGAKFLGLGVALAVFIGLSGALAMPFRPVQAKLVKRERVLLAYAGTYAAGALLAVLPLLGGGLAGADTSSGVGFAALSQILAGALYAAVLDYFLVDFSARHPEGFSPTRRQFIVGLGVLFMSSAIAIAGLGALAARTARLTFATIQDLFAHEITPTPEFYVVTKNLMDPDVDPIGWRLRVDGLVGSEGTYTLDDLRARADAEELVTLECVSNEVGGNLMSTARWRGVRVADLLADAGIAAEADWVAFACADGYTVAVPRAKALSPATLVAIEMNGAPLLKAHGAPARIVVPGLYGMFHAKWLTRITAARGEFLGFWQQKGWTNRGAIRTTAIITTPAPDRVVGSPVAIGGVALAGDRGISRVEVRVDGWTDWVDATLSPALSGATWVLWTFTWTPPSGGAYRFIVRATDGLGTPQEARSSPPFPDGASGYDAVTLYVSG
jgi:DMSO/TMAO reductase YedYZ molybdopterin-dependent catalytic subunit